MDRKIEKQKTKLKKLFIYSILFMVLAYGIYNLFFSGFSFPSIDSDKIRIGTVRRGPLDVLVSGNGVITAKNPEWIVAKVSGQVVKSTFKAGDSVKKGDILVEIINEDVISAYAKSNSELRAAMADFSAMEVSLQSQRIGYESDVLKTELDSKQASSYYEAVKMLWEKGSPPISQIEYANASIKAEQMKGLADAARKRFQSFKEIEIAQMHAFKFRLESYREENTRLKSRMNDLKIIANSDGILQNLNLTAGQGIASGDPIAQIINPQSTFVTLNIPAIQSFKISASQKVNLEIDRKSVHGVVHRIDPNVKGTTVDVDVYFDENITDAKIGMFVNGTIFTKQITDTLYVEIPSHVVENGKMSVFVVSSDNKYADFVKIKSGVLSSNYLQIIEGLREGDKIILSDISAMNTNNKIKLN